ncbi:SigE-dependent sporulation protein [Pontibacillus chungwhensis BH030062]|uniref:SigE-dependent sporulation protein n=1 Tax=Pontibacillus chungwhensis BH030062 TaxID=1385513 RepID=A0A0A2UQ03_9BACI|nr:MULTISPECIES: sporulation YhaL family protein [Pontibacillus]KGP90034.1 SigE-dependent sporulation protein [Pontibacillus chungwhensis BH030062]QST00713.1 sporulation YhaL family protein [Pontibacillus sp. ALD_SL1]
MIAGIPWWVLAMVVFILFSGYMALRAMKAEQEMEQKFIEQEGKKYMDRIDDAKKRKQSASS